jgi:hypothetical protein
MPQFPDLLCHESLYFLFLWQFELIFGDKELVVHAGKGILYQGIIFPGTEQDSYGRIVAFGHFVLFIPAYICIELAYMFMTEFIDLQFDQHMAFKNAVVKDQVNEVMGISDQDTLLPGLKPRNSKIYGSRTASSGSTGSAPDLTISASFSLFLESPERS